MDGEYQLNCRFSPKKLYRSFFAKFVGDYDKNDDDVDDGDDEDIVVYLRWDGMPWWLYLSLS